MNCPHCGDPIYFNHVCHLAPSGGSIPKIPDSPDTRHAEAAGTTIMCPHCGEHQSERIAELEEMEKQEAAFMAKNGILYDCSFIDGWLKVLNERDELRERITQLEAENKLLRSDNAQLQYALEQSEDAFRKQCKHTDLVRAEYQKRLEHVLDPIVRQKMLEPPPSFIIESVELLKRAERAEADTVAKDERIAVLELALQAMVSPVKHLDGCLWKGDPRMSCQCGYGDRINNAIKAARALLAKKGE